MQDNKRPGRKPVGDKAKTAYEMVKARRDVLKAEGWRYMWVSPEEALAAEHAAEKLNSDTLRNLVRRFSGIKREKDK